MEIGPKFFPGCSIVLNLCGFAVALWYGEWKKAVYCLSGATITWSAVF